MNRPDNLITDEIVQKARDVHEAAAPSPMEPLSLEAMRAALEAVPDLSGYREALEQIEGHFLPGDHPKLCYADAITTLKMIRAESRQALGLLTGLLEDEDEREEMRFGGYERS